METHCMFQFDFGMVTHCMFHLLAGVWRAWVSKVLLKLSAILQPAPSKIRTLRPCSVGTYVYMNADVDCF